MFSAAARGIPSFGDLSWKRPVDFVTDVSLSWDFPLPTLSPAGGAVPGQTLTKNGNGALSAEPCMIGTVLSVGDRLLVAATNPGIWIVTDLGSAGTPWVLTRATDADTTAKLPTGTITTASDFALDGGLFSAARAFFSYDGSVFELLPNVATQFSVLNDAFFGLLGAADPAVDVNGRLNSDTVSVEGPAYADTVTLDNTSRDVRLRRSAAKTLTIDDAAGAALTAMILTGAAKLQLGSDIRLFRSAAKLLSIDDGATVRTILDAASGMFSEYGDNAPQAYTPTVTNFGTATFTTRAGRWYRIGKMVYVRIEITINAAGSGGGTLGIDLPSNATVTGGRPMLNMQFGGMTGLTQNEDAGTAIRLTGSGNGATLDRLRTVGTTALARANLQAGAFIHIAGWYEEA